ncbi:MAG: hypothetical protein Q7S92_00775 [Candidatus Diapherotrites archaeon]|nr:hypothetical protein [Candidatus Diapherotrites archaeon]
MKKPGIQKFSSERKGFKPLVYFKGRREHIQRMRASEIEQTLSQAGVQFSDLETKKRIAKEFKQTVLKAVRTIRKERLFGFKKQ